ncbi:limbic system-associated membrane protein isoform X2 [Pristis pectinata]|uniref:limbic system-associated membrane protein isoform X2 n=1 Tax=Pristis pectinata TaxID=685728 RepID=UPI00223D2E85|nr:limbic system-associated membrane protein isoform X2 [Pristis pectinata]XP_051869614.1 limbic system-associated membrane protein isoform X2 [Pristis pectinata]
MRFYVVHSIGILGFLSFFAFQGLPVRSVDFSRGTDNITIRQGNTAILRCYVDDRISKVAWLNRSNIIFAGNDKWSLDPRVTLLTSAHLEYSLQIQQVDVSDEGPYTCSVQTQHHPKTYQVHLIVQVPPKIYNISSNITVNEGSNVTLVCLANGRPEPVINWRHISPSAKEIEEEEEYLEIFMINRYQAGAYQCKAANEVASADEKQVHITVNYAPAIKYAQSADVAVGRTGMLHCEVSAVPPADFEWYKEDKRIYNSSQGIQIQNMESRSSLIVTNATEDHYGNYTCVAGNKLGVTNASIFLYKSILPTIPNPVPVSGRAVAIPTHETPCQEASNRANRNHCALKTKRTRFHARLRHWISRCHHITVAASSNSSLSNLQMLII